MELEFTKMHGLGNDFVLIDALDAPVTLEREQIVQLAERRRGVGFDQLLLLEPPRGEGSDLLYRIFNADGAEVEQCGNGARCVGLYLSKQRGWRSKDIVADTVTGTIRLRVLEDDRVAVEMGCARFEPAEIPLALSARETTYRVNLDGEFVSFVALSIGNPHAVLLVDSVADAQVGRLGPALQSSGLFPEGVNVGFMAIRGPAAIDLRVFERGVGETLACGSGACAAVAAGRSLGRLEERVRVNLPGGELDIQWSGKQEETIWMTGPAALVFRGKMTL